MKGKTTVSNTKKPQFASANEFIVSRWPSRYPVAEFWPGTNRRYPVVLSRCKRTFESDRLLVCKTLALNVCML